MLFFIFCGRTSCITVHFKVCVWRVLGVPYPTDCRWWINFVQGGNTLRGAKTKPHFKPPFFILKWFVPLWGYVLGDYLNRVKSVGV
jgi:hypothetical protein